MTKIISAVVALLFGCLVASDVAAKSSSETIQDCFSALSQNDPQAIKSASDAVRKLRHLSETLEKVDAATCVSKATGETWSYHPFLGGVVPNSVKEWITTLIGERSKGFELYDALNEQTVSDGVYLSCQELYRQNQMSAMTNQSCIDAFRVNGHPSLPRKEDFVRQKVLALIQGERDEVLELVSEFFPN